MLLSRIFCLSSTSGDRGSKLNVSSINEAKSLSGHSCLSVCHHIKKIDITMFQNDGDIVDLSCAAVFVLFA